MPRWGRVMRRRSRKRIAKAADIKVLGSLGRDDLKKLCGDNFPEWISFPQFEQAALQGLKKLVLPSYTDAFVQNN